MKQLSYKRALKVNQLWSYQRALKMKQFSNKNAREGESIFVQKGAEGESIVIVSE